MASNVVWSSIYLGNLAEIDTDESSVAGENTNILLTTFGSIEDPLYKNRVDITTDSADDTMTSNNTGAVDTVSYDLGAGPQVSEIDTGTFVNITITYVDGTTANDNVAIYQDTLGNVFLVAMDGQTNLSAQGIRSITGNSIITSGSSDSQYNYDSVEFVCFAEGTMIMTPEGECPVESLRPGDEVMTLDNGPQPIRWVRSSHHSLEEAEIDDKPVFIQAGALGKELPSQDLIVSPQHRMFVGGHGQLDGWFKAEALAPAKSLTALPGIRHMKGEAQIIWIHFACARHEVVTANGCLSESLLLGPMVVNGLTRAEQRDLIAIYGAAPKRGGALNGPAARACLKFGEVKHQLAKRKEETLRRTAKEIKKWDRDFAMERWELDRLGVAMATGQKPDLDIAC